ncbi:MAG: hypothetical protein ACLTSZ_04705 [Lachnospiraceae bacterium]
MEDDELEELAGQIIEETRYVENVPVRVSLKEQRTVGIVGEKGGCLLSAAQHARGACDHAQLPGRPHHWPVRGGLHEDLGAHPLAAAYLG